MEGMGGVWVLRAGAGLCLLAGHILDHFTVRHGDDLHNAEDKLCYFGAASVRGSCLALDAGNHQRTLARLVLESGVGGAGFVERSSCDVHSLFSLMDR